MAIRSTPHSKWMAGNWNNSLILTPNRIGFDHVHPYPAKHQARIHAH